MEPKTGLGSIRSLDYVILLCDDFEAMKRFYLDVFGFQIEDEAAGVWIGFRVGTFFLALRPRGRQYDGPAIPEQSAYIQLSFRVPPADVDIAYRELIDKGVDVIEKPTNQDWPHRTLFVRDPENNIIEIFADIHPRDMAASPTWVHDMVRG
ncbi:MAG: VOC family protein [Pseudomonadota bacterium]